MLLLGWPELELKVGGDGGVEGVIGRGQGVGVLGAPVDGTDISGQVVLEQ